MINSRAGEPFYDGNAKWSLRLIQIEFVRESLRDLNKTVRYVQVAKSKLLEFQFAVQPSNLSTQISFL